MNNKYAIAQAVDFIEDRVNGDLINSDHQYLHLKVLDSRGLIIQDEEYHQTNGQAFLVDYSTGLTLATVNWANYEDPVYPDLVTITPYKYKNPKANISATITCFNLHLLNLTEASIDNYLFQYGDDNFHTKKGKKILKTFRINFSDHFQFTTFAIAVIGIIFWGPIIIWGIQAGLVVFLLLLLVVTVIMGIYAETQ
jgi:magnesium-transporting ATPase (P-type)